MAQTDLPQHAKTMVDDLLQDVQPHVTSIRDSLAMINMIETKYGVPATTMFELLAHLGGDDQPTANAPVDRPAGGQAGAGPLRRVSIRPDQFLGQQPLDAAKAYLALVNSASTIDDIAEAVRQGGAATPPGPKWRDTLETSLIRSTSDVIKVRDGVFGLVKFYTPDQIKGLRDARRQAIAPKRGKTRKRGRPAAKQAAAPKKAPKATSAAADDRKLESAPAGNQATGEEITLQ
jgi:hypothetical protein